jgi:hypothetical protein
MHVRWQWLLIKWLPDMHGRNPVPAIGLVCLFGCVLKVLIREHDNTIPHHRDGKQNWCFGVAVHYHGGSFEAYHL